MTRLRTAAVFVAVASGDYAILMLINGQLIVFGFASAICAGASVTAGLIRYADRRRRRTLARRRAVAWERRYPQQAASDQRSRP